MKAIYTNCVRFTLLTVMACFCWSQLSQGTCAQENDPGNEGFAEDLTPEMVTLLKQRVADRRRITIREANLFHLHFIDTCMKVMPQEVRLGYRGLLATDDGRHPLRAIGSIGIPLGWGVGRDGLGVFAFWISTRHTTQTLAKCKIDGREFFVNVDFVTDGQSVDTKLPELDGYSVREVLQAIEKPQPKPDSLEGASPEATPDVSRLIKVDP